MSASFLLARDVLIMVMTFKYIDTLSEISATDLDSMREILLWVLAACVLINYRLYVKLKFSIPL
jgi:hypothetical protein